MLYPGSFYDVIGCGGSCGGIVKLGKVSNQDPTPGPMCEEGS